MNKQTDKLDIANWTAERMRKMHQPITERKFMEGGLTPHQYMTKEIEALLKHYISRDEVMEIIGEDVDYDTTDTEPYWSMENNEGANQLRAKLRQALTTNEEE